MGHQDLRDEVSLGRASEVLVHRASPAAMTVTPPKGLLKPPALIAAKADLITDRGIRRGSGETESLTDRSIFQR